MNNLLWLLAAAIFLLAALFPALTLIADPQRRHRRLLAQSLRSGLISADDYQLRLQQLDQQPAPRRRGLALTLLLLMPAIGLWLYQQVGTPAALDPPVAEANMTMDQAIAALQQRLNQDRDNPEQVEGWMLLGNSLKQVQRYADAVAALEQANRLVPGNPDIQVELAEALLFASGQPRLPTAAQELLDQALSNNPQQQKGLWLAGLAAYQRAEYASAVGYWQRLRPLISDASVAARVDQQIMAARAAAGEDLSILGGSAPDSGSDNSESGSPMVEVIIQLSPELTAKPPQDGAIFVFARDPNGGPPLAGKRLPPGEWPLSVTLDNSDAMLPGRNLSSADQVIIGARWSLSSTALAQPGDWQASSATIDLPADGPVNLTIDQIITAEAE
ncbi:MAG: tetratricopeptide repeat protein [Wenzhouxiangellaceae bacterium]